MTDARDDWQQTAEAWGRRFDAVTDAQSDRPTPCDGWTVRDLIDHAVSVQQRFGALLGLEVHEGSAWPAVQAAMTRLLARPGALEGSVDVAGLGEMTREQILSICTNDLLIHTWDLARGLGVDAELPAGPVRDSHAWLQQMPVELIRSPGRYGPPLDPPPGADEQARFLAFAGRQA